ncbi:hypothetical protein Tco_0435159 [Tanacetum coccineum]
MPTNIELTLEQSQHVLVSNDVLVSIEGLKNEKNVWKKKGERKALQTTKRQNRVIHNLSIHKMIVDIEERSSWTSDAMHNPSQPFKILVSFITEIHTLSIDISHRDSFGRHLVKIHMIWAQFGKKPDMMAIWHEDGLKNQDQSVETALRLLVTPSGFESDDVKIFVMTSGHSRHKVTLKESR